MLSGRVADPVRAGVAAEQQDVVAALVRLRLLPVAEHAGDEVALRRHDRARVDQHGHHQDHQQAVDDARGQPVVLLQRQRPAEPVGVDEQRGPADREQDQQDLDQPQRLRRDQQVDRPGPPDQREQQQEDDDRDDPEDHPPGPAPGAFAAGRDLRGSGQDQGHQQQRQRALESHRFGEVAQVSLLLRHVVLPFSVRRGCRSSTGTAPVAARRAPFSMAMAGRSPESGAPPCLLYPSGHQVRRTGRVHGSRRAGSETNSNRTRTQCRRRPGPGRRLFSPQRERPDHGLLDRVPSRIVRPGPQRDLLRPSRYCGSPDLRARTDLGHRFEQCWCPPPVRARPSSTPRRSDAQPGRQAQSPDRGNKAAHHRPDTRRKWGTSRCPAPGRTSPCLSGRWSASCRPTRTGEAEGPRNPYLLGISAPARSSSKRAWPIARRTRRDAIH